MTEEEIEAERRDRVQSEETMLQLLEQTCSQIALQRAKETGQTTDRMFVQKLSNLPGLGTGGKHNNSQSISQNLPMGSNSI